MLVMTSPETPGISQHYGNERFKMASKIRESPQTYVNILYVRITSDISRLRIGLVIGYVTSSQGGFKCLHIARDVITRRF